MADRDRDKPTVSPPIRGGSKPADRIKIPPIPTRAATPPAGMPVIPGHAPPPSIAPVSVEPISVEMEADEPAIEVPTPTPTRLGDYEVLREIGSGGMAEVFLARQLGPAGFEKLAVLKCIHRHLAREKYFIDMFLDEARLAARINDPHVVQIYELGESNGTYFMAMEYLVGETLSAVMKVTVGRGPALPPHFAARIAADVAAGLHAAHELHDDVGRSLDVVHRDVSHGNVVVLYSGIVKVLDFGVAKARDSLSSTAAGSIKGKYAYMSPEQVSDQPVDRRSDIFSLGVVLWEMLARRTLFLADTDTATARRIVEGIVPPPSSIVAQVPPELDQITLRALAKDPKQRFQTAEEMQIALESFLRASGVAAGSLELGSYMKAAFPERLERRSRLVKAAQLDTELPTGPAEFSLETGPARTGAPPRTLPLKMVAGGDRRLKWMAIALCAMFALSAAYWIDRWLGSSAPPVASVQPPPPPPPIVAAAAQPDPTLANSLLDRAEAAIRDGRLASPPGDNALELILESEKLRPDPRQGKLRSEAVASLLASAQLLWEHGKHDSARDFYSDVVLFDPNNAVAIARLKVEIATPKPASDHARVDEGKIAWLVAQIDLAILERRFVAPPGHNALEALLELRRIDPTNQAANQLGAQVADALKREAKATPAEGERLIAAANQASGITGAGSASAHEPDKSRDSDQAKQWTAKGAASLGAGRFAEARSEFERAIAVDSNAHAAIAGLAEVAYNEGDFIRAVLMGKHAVALAPNSIGDRMTLAKAYYKLLRYDDAIRQWDKALALDPSNAAAKRNIAMAKTKLGQ